MISKTRSFRDPRNPIGVLILLAAFAAAAGCSTAESPSGSGTNLNHVLPSGSSVPGWLVVPSGGSHASTATLDYIANGGSSSCTECHGSDLAGGISRVSCFGNTAGCHHGPVAGWVALSPAVQNHGVSAKKAPGSSGFASCQICHGRNFTGSTIVPTCLNTAACHGAGVASPHAPKPWRASAGTTYTHTTTDPANAPVCALCHFPGSSNNPAGHPDPATPAPEGTPPECFNNTLCHAGSVVPHPVPFNDPVHYNTTSVTFPGTTFPPGCITCHDISGPSTKAGPVCQTCHTAASPLTAANCTSCHASPPDSGAPAGAAYPNIAGAHSTHIALTSAGTPISCDTCHNGLGPSLLNLNHYNRAKARVAPGDAAFLATYFAKTGASSFDNGVALSCSNVSCHGGQATPNWQTGALDVNTQCASCHALGTSQFNSYVSGKHNQIAHSLFPCTVCHNTTSLAVNHFTTLADNSISPAVAAATIGGTFITTWTPTPGTTSGTCNATCHPGDRTW